MNCPVCQTASFTEKSLESGLLALECFNCGGYWIKSFQYWVWRNQLKNDLPEKPPEEGLPLPVKDSKGGICPECFKFLTKYEVGHEIPFKLDRCNTCGGMWFDRNEWEILKSRNMHDDIHYIFTGPWQAKVMKEKMLKSKEDFFKKKFGEKDYQELQTIKQWIASKDYKYEIIAYLQETIF